MDVKSTVVQIIGRLAEIDNINELIEGNDSLDGFAINSVNFIRVVVELEKTFDIEFEDDALEFTKFDTLQSLCDYIECKINARPCTAVNANAGGV